MPSARVASDSDLALAVLTIYNAVNVDLLQYIAGASSLSPVPLVMSAKLTYWR
jgi:hypothetical protein